MDKPIEGLRREYALRGLNEAEADPDPLRQFDNWFDSAVREGLMDPNAMSLATVDADQRPHVRIVLLKGFDQRGFVFYTDYESRKGRELEINPWAEVCFWWSQLERQVRISGSVEKIAPAESDAYFASRPRESEIGAYLSHQSEVIAGREVLEAARRRVEEEFAGRPIPRPARWGGYRLRPERYEFWQGRPFRLHDRLEYVLEAGGAWRMRRLSP